MPCLSFAKLSYELDFSPYNERLKALINIWENIRNRHAVKNATTCSLMYSTSKITSRPFKVLKVYKHWPGFEIRLPETNLFQGRRVVQQRRSG